jgi:hypothetical protein
MQRHHQQDDEDERARDDQSAPWFCRCPWRPEGTSELPVLAPPHPIVRDALRDPDADRCPDEEMQHHATVVGWDVRVIGAATDAVPRTGRRGRSQAL